MPQEDISTPPCFVSLHRLAQLCGRNRVTLLLRLKDGALPPDALLDVGRGRSLPLFHPDRAVLLLRQTTHQSAAPPINPML